MQQGQGQQQAEAQTPQCAAWCFWYGPQWRRRSTSRKLCGVFGAQGRLGVQLGRLEVALPSEWIQLGWIKLA